MGKHFLRRTMPSGERITLRKWLHEMFYEGSAGFLGKTWDWIVEEKKPSMTTTATSIWGLFTQTPWIIWVAGSAMVFGFSMWGFNQWDMAWDRRRKNRPALFSEGDIPVYFGAPVQRWKEDETISHWCVPIRIDQEKIETPNYARSYSCELYLDGYSDGKSSKGKEGIPLWVGDVGLGTVTEKADLVAGRVYLVPIAWRSEKSDEKSAYITDGRFFWVPRQYEYPVFPNREKQRYHLRVKSAFFDCVSPHFYFLRVPTSSSNGHFVLEMEHK